MSSHLLDDGRAAAADCHVQGPGSRLQTPASRSKMPRFPSQVLGIAETQRILEFLDSLLGLTFMLPSMVL
jgi:hypothetical protein